MEHVLDALRESWALVRTSAPWLLIGFTVAGLLEALVPASWIQRTLGGGRYRSVVRAAFVGAPLPLCSCSVLPTATALRRSGASRGSTTAFLISTPETGVDSIGVTWALIDPVMTLMRPLGAVLTALGAGSVVNHLDRKGWLGPDPQAGPPPADAPEAAASCCDADPAPPPPAASCCDSDPAPAAPPTPVTSCCDTEPAPTPAAACCADEVEPPRPTATGAARGPGWPLKAWRQATGPILRDLAPWLLIGFLLSGVITVWLPADVFEYALLGGWTGMLITLAFGVPVYVCASASTPVIAAMMAKGLDPGPALVFLLAGPATNLATLSVIRGTLGTKVLGVYLTSIALGALALGHLAEWVYPLLEIEPSVAFSDHAHVHDSALSSVAGVLVVAALAFDMARRVARRLEGAPSIRT